MKEESVFALSIIACVFPVVFVIAAFFENAEPYNCLVFLASLMEGAFAGSIFGIIALVCNRRAKSRKIFILSLIPVFTLLILIINSLSHFNNMP